MKMNEDKGGQLRFDFSKDVKPKSHQDYEIEAAKYQEEHRMKPEKPTSFQELNSENRDLLTDEEYSDMMLAEQEYMEDLREQWAEEARANAAKKAEKKVVAVFGPKNDRHMPEGYTNTFPRDEMGNQYDDGFSFDEKE